MVAVESREVYPNAPVVLVTLEVRHPTADKLTHAGIQNKIKRRLGENFPILRLTKVTNVEAVVGTAPTVTVEEFPRYFSRDNTCAISFKSGAVVIETTKYQGWEDFRNIALLALEVRQEFSPVDGVERIGLRYIDELRVPDVDGSVESWAPWVDATLLGPAAIAGRAKLIPFQWQGATVYETGQGRSVVLRHGAREGYAVDPGGELKRSTPTPGPFFWLDIDSFWSSGNETPALDPKAVVEICDELHTPVRSLFETLITDRMREEVLRVVE